MDRLYGVFSDDESLYDIRRPGIHADVADFELGFCDIAAGPYEALVDGTIDVLAAMPGVEDVWQGNREVVLVRAPEVSAAQLAEVVDRYWLDALRHTAPDPAYGDDLDPPDLARAWSHEPEPAERRSPAAELLLLAPSRRRMWTYLACGGVATLGGLVLAVTPGGRAGVLALAVGVVNLGVGLNLARRRRAAGHGSTRTSDR
jgi:hypothetical protein